jgi:hypothetical protein
VAETPVEDYSNEVLDAVDFAPVVGLSWGGDEKSLLEFSFVIDKDKEREHFIDVSTPKVKGRGSSKIWNAPLILMLEVGGLPR